MKNVFLILFCTLNLLNNAWSQNADLKWWDKRFGGINGDWNTSIQQTSDGGFIFGGYSGSGISGDKSEPSRGSLDYWIVKIDSLGNKQWDKSFGGTNLDELQSVRQTSDGGYILGGLSNSGIGGDKTEASRGLYDYWILKTDSLGNKEWDKTFGGSDNDYLFSVRQTFDGGFILGGWSLSGVSGDKINPSWGYKDYWIIKTDSLGNKIWEEVYGGTADDWFTSLELTSDGGFILCGYSRSGISGDKTQDSYGYSDYWIIKTDALGTMQWDKDYGGADDEDETFIIQTADGGFIVGGSSNSGTTGNKSVPGWGSTDYWIIKTDAQGNEQWQIDLGGTDTEVFGTVSLTSDGGYLFSGISYSPISGNKTEANLGLAQTWLVKTDSMGTVLWDKTIFTDGTDKYSMSLQTRDGCYVFANNSNAGIAGYKSQDNWGGISDDYWMVKFCDSTFIQANLTGVNDLCPGTCTDFVNLSFNASSYQWSFPGAIPDTSTAFTPTNICYSNPGSYDVQLIVNNPFNSDTIFLNDYIHIYPSPSALFIVRSGDTLSANPGSTSYQWYYNGNLIPGATDYSYVIIADGDYSVVATDINGCESEAILNGVLGMEQLSFRNLQLAIYPNPVTNKFTIHPEIIGTKVTPDSYRDGTAMEISIYNVFGVRIYKAAYRDPDSYRESTVNCELFPSGIYSLEIISGEKIYRTKFVKQ